jgi:hypothetical protein
MAQYSVRVACKAGCLDKVAHSLTRASTQINSLACACETGVGDGFATFSLAEEKVKLDFDAKATEISVLHMNVRNQAGCLSQVLSPLGKAGVSIGSLACACGAGDASCTVAVGLLPRTAAA